MKSTRDNHLFSMSSIPGSCPGIATVLSVALLTGCTTTINQPPAQPVIASSEPPGWNEYSSKFVCGTILPTTNVTIPLNVGRYFTTINVHNPSLNEELPLWYKVVVSEKYPELKDPSPFKRAALGPDRSLYVDCEEIKSLAAVGAQFIEGWMVILTPDALDVSPVYSAGSTQSVYPVQSIEVERVDPTKVDSRNLELVGVPAPGHCPGGKGCCCNISNRSSGQPWPACNTGLECRGWRPGPTPPAGPVATCTEIGRSPVFAEPLHHSQPAFCGNP